MGDNGIFFVENADAGGYGRSVGRRAHFFGLGMAMGEPGWPRGGEALGAALKPYKQRARGDFSRAARVMMGTFLRRIRFSY